MIRKLSSGGYRLYSRKINPATGKRRNLGTFRSREEAEAHERAVVEMGFYHPGDIKFLAELARPQVGVVNNVYAVHLERAGSLEALARGKAELVEALGPGQKPPWKQRVPVKRREADDTVTLEHTGHERTAVRFRLADNGNVVDVSHREKSLIQLTRSVRRTAK